VTLSALEDSILTRSRKGAKGNNDSYGFFL